MPDYDKAASAAADLLRRYGYTKPPIDPEKIAEAEGLNVLYASFAGDAAREYSGFFRLEDGSIVVNDAIPTNRITFTIAHELGHSCLHEDYIRSNSYKPMPRTNRHEGKKPIEEVEADTFAANLLVPLWMLDKYKNAASIDELASLFFVSRDVIANRLDLLRRYPQLARKR